MGEAEWMTGYKDAAQRFFSEAEMLVGELSDPSQRFGALWNLACAFRRIGEFKYEIDYLRRCLEILPESETEKILEVDRRLGELNRLP